MTRKDEDDLNDILHNLDHQKYEAIGVERLAKESQPLMSGILLLIRTIQTINAQDLAVISMLNDMLQEKACMRCLDLSLRIKAELMREFAEWEKEKGR